MLKLLAGLETRERSKPQSGGVKAEYEETPYELQVVTTPVKGGAERLVIRIRNLTETLEKADELGMRAGPRPAPRPGRPAGRRAPSSRRS